MNRRHLLSLAMLCLMPAAAHAGLLPAPTSEVVLTIGGSISNTNQGNTLEFDLAMLRQLPKVVVKTTTPWTEGVTTFEGVALADVIAAAGGAGKTLNAIAINDYAAELQTDDAVRNGAFIAYAMNGKEMSVREKGPLWILYPFDDKPELKAESYYAHCVWQLKALSIHP